MGKSSWQRRKDSGAKQKAHRSTAFAWKSVDVSRKGDSEDKLKRNHYDNASLRKSASKDLEALPQEAPGIFFGLEVLGGDSYRVEEDPETKQKRMLPVASIESDTAISTNSGDESPPATKKRRTEKKAINVMDLPVVDASSESDTKSTKTKTKQADSEKPQVPQAAKMEEKAIDPSVNKKKKKKKSKKKASQKDEDENDEARETIDPEQITNLQTSWSSQTGGVSLHPTLCKSLIRQKFWAPTPIQASALPASILGRRNIVGAAPTGSGKTLAFLLPIGQSLLDKPQEDRCLVALILTPTRELATQIQSESDKLLPGMAGSLVGGLAHAKQIRILEKKRPPILIATPGRLWEMMSSRDYDHLNELSRIRFLVIDEADRMTNQGSFPQLSSILDAVQRANPMEDSDDEDDESDESDDEQGEEDRLLGLPGFPGEAKLTMLSDDILDAIERERESGRGARKPEIKEVGDDEFDVADDLDNGEEDDASQISLPLPPPVHRQTFVYSATLTLPATPNFSKRSPKRKPRYDASVDGAIAEILEKSRAKGKTKVVDLSNLSRKASSDPAGEGNSNYEKEAKEKSPKKDSFRLPDGLTLQQIKCTQRHKDSHLYAYLMTTAEGASGPSLVFCNSIAGVRRVGATLQSLGLDVRILHAQMQQRARFKAVELLSESKRRTVVVATDVAARGLDIPSVASVVHYDTARTVDSFVHRSGRTARGVGANAVGCSVSLVAPDEDKMHNAIVSSLGAKFERVAMDGRLLHEAQERVNLASKVAEVADIERKSQRQNQWTKEKAADAGLELDEDLLEEGLSKGDRRDRAKLVDADRARQRLAEMLSQPMRTQRFGKFLSTNSAFKQDLALPAARPATQAIRSKKRQRRR